MLYPSLPLQKLLLIQTTDIESGLKPTHQTKKASPSVPSGCAFDCSVGCSWIISEDVSGADKNHPFQFRKGHISNLFVGTPITIFYALCVYPQHYNAHL